MTLRTSYTGFFGDGEYTFRLTAPLILELETKLNAPIGGVCERVFHRAFSHADLSETIRLGLIGGGMSPERAAKLIAAYVQDRPLAETQPVAEQILSALWFGNEE